METENYYWLFSAAAQSIAALIAFLMAGVALAFSMMDRIVDKDDTLFDVVESLKRKQHREMAALAIATGVAIIASLFAVYINPCQTRIRNIIMIFAAITDVTVVISAIYFVITIIMPGRYIQVALKEYDKAKGYIDSIPGQESVQVFFKEFIALEKDIRSFLQDHDIYEPSRGAPRMSYSFRQMIDALYQHEKISKELKDIFMQVNKFRNLLFHGHKDQVDEGVISILRYANTQWQDLKVTNNS